MSSASSRAYVVVEPAEASRSLLPEVKDFVALSEHGEESVEADHTRPDDEMSEDALEDAEEAKVNRKVCWDLMFLGVNADGQIADLEISNASLMAINKMLESEWSGRDVSDVSYQSQATFGDTQTTPRLT